VILGIGTDLVVVSDLRRRMERTPEIVDRAFDPAEVEYCRRMADPAPHLAARFAAKEAVMKALGTGWGKGVGFQDIVVVRDGDEAPTVTLRGVAADLLGRIGGRVRLSLTHAGDLAVAFAVVDGDAPAQRG